MSSKWKKACAVSEEENLGVGIGITSRVGFGRRLGTGLVCLWMTVAVLAFMATPALAVREYAPTGSFGSAGSGAGEFKEPTSLAVNDSLTEATAGEVYVLDSGNDRIERFNASGSELKGQFDGSETPAGSFSGPEGIAIDNSGESSLADPAAGDVYVVDVGHGVIDRFSATGHYEGQLTGTCENAEESAIELGACPSSAAKKVIPFEGLHGVAVDAEGDVWVYASEDEGKGQLDEFDDTGVFLKSFDTGHGALPALAVDARQDLYVLNLGEEVFKFDGVTGAELAGLEVTRPATDVAVNPASNDLLVDKESAIDLFGSYAEPYEQPPLQTFAGTLSESHGLAVNGSSALAPVYASQRGEDDVKVFEDLIFPTVATRTPSEVAESSVTLNGSVTPEGEEITGCVFEYGPSAVEPGEYPNTLPCEQTPAEIDALSETGEPTVPVSVKVSGLETRQTYHYRLTAANAHGSRSGRDESVFTVSGPLIEAEASAEVGMREATLSAQIDASGLPTAYDVEYGTTAAYGSSTPEASLSAVQSPVGVQVQLGGLQPATEYHFRFLTSNAFGATQGADMTFKTAPPPSAGGSECPNSKLSGFSASLPDCRAWELVSDEDTPGELYVPLIPENVPHGDADIPTALPFQAAASGNAVSYVADAAEVGGTGDVGGGLGIQYLASRDPQQGGWSVSTITPQASNSSEAGEVDPTFEAFSAELSVGLLGVRSPNFVQSTNPPGPLGCDVLYARAEAGMQAGDYQPLFTETQTPGECGALNASPPQRLQFAGGNAGSEALSPYADLLFETPAALAAGSTQAAAHGAGSNLYESIASRIFAVNVLPDGQQDPDAVFGAPGTQPTETHSAPDLSDVISDDGSRIFWTDLGTTVSAEDPGGQTRLFVREDAALADAATVEIDAAEVPTGAGTAETEERALRSGGGRFWTASRDGSKVLFTDESRLTEDSTAEPGAPNLYQYDFDAAPGTRLSDLTAQAGAGVQGVLGASEDGSYVYFVAQGALSSEANAGGETPQPRVCEEARGEEYEGHLPSGFGCNLYLWRAGQPLRFIAALAAKDDHFTIEGAEIAGDWAPDLGVRLAEVTPDGHQMVFESTQQLTGYDNSDLENAGAGEETSEVFVYDAEASPSARLVCASCAPDGAAPTAPVSKVLGAGATYLPTSFQPTSMRRWISDDGSRVFFESAQLLSAEDVDGKENVYEWEREGMPGCPLATSVFGGCVSLLSGGDSGDDSFFVDADASGDNVFFTHRGELAGVGALDDKAELFDARVDGGFASASLACTGSGCQGVPPAAPSFATPASVTFAGVGNYPPQPVALKPKSKPKLKKCPKGKRRKHGKCVKTGKRKHKPENSTHKGKR